MKTDMAGRYQFQYLMLVREFLAEVEKGTEWARLKPIVQEMKRLDHDLESIDGAVNIIDLSLVQYKVAV
jgi:hypothetical protein